MLKKRQRRAARSRINGALEGEGIPWFHAATGVRRIGAGLGDHWNSERRNRTRVLFLEKPADRTWNGGLGSPSLGK